MKLYKFAHEQKNLVDRFVAYWAEQHKLHPEDFPEELGESEWLEQMLIFEQTEVN